MIVHSCFWPWINALHLNVKVVLLLPFLFVFNLELAREKKIICKSSATSLCCHHIEELLSDITPKMGVICSVGSKGDRNEKTVRCCKTYARCCAPLRTLWKASQKRKPQSLPALKVIPEATNSARSSGTGCASHHSLAQAPANLLPKRWSHSDDTNISAKTARWEDLGSETSESSTLTLHSPAKAILLLSMRHRLLRKWIKAQ